MKELEKMYDIIFEDERLQELFLNFHSKNWYGLDVDQKFSILEEINDRVSKLYGYEKNKIKRTETSFYGAHSTYNWKIVVGNDSLENDNGYEVIDTYFHELRHAFQCRAVEGKLTALETVDNDLVEKWSRNFIPGNYISCEGPHYLYQYVERDAWATGLLFAKKVYMLNKTKIFTSDKEWENYCQIHRQTIIDLLSENEKSKKLLEKKDKEIEELFKENLKDLNEYKLGKEYVQRILNSKKIEDLSFEEIALLMSKYSFSYLDISSKVKVISRYYDLIKVCDEKYPIKLNTLGSIRLGKSILSSESSLSMINSILSFNFEKIVEAVCKDKDIGYSFSMKVKKELKLNMYENEDGKKINFIKDSDNMFLFALQPYARYESSYVLSEFKRLKDIELEYFKKNHSHWNYWEGFYSNKLIFKTASKLMDMKFSDYYELQLEKYKKKILLDKKKTSKR